MINSINLEQLTTQIKKFKEKHPTIDPATVSVIIGNDEELNGVHDAYFAEEVDAYSSQDKYITEMIKESRCGASSNSNPRYSFLIS